MKRGATFDEVLLHFDRRNVERQPVREALEYEGLHFPRPLQADISVSQERQRALQELSLEE